jgi:exosortase
MATTELAPTPSRAALWSIPWLALLGAVCVSLALMPFLAAHAWQIWLRPHYQFFPLAIVGSVVLLTLNARNLGQLAPGSARWTGLFFVVAWLALAAAELLDSSWMGAVAALLTLGAVLFAAGGSRLLHAGLPAMLLLLVVIPPPFELDRSLVLWLQAWTAHWGSRILDLLGIYHVLAGNVVEISGRKYLVEEACSGVNSLFSVLACTLFFVGLTRRTVVAASIVVASAVVWTLAANVLRVVAIAYLGAVDGIDIGEGWAHQAVGLALFALVLAMVWSTDRLAVFLTAPSRGAVPVTEPDNAGPTKWCPLRASVLFPVAVAYGLLAGFHHATYGGLDASGGTQVAATVEPEHLAATTLPAKLGRLERKTFTTASRNPGSEFGESSRIWVYQLDSVTATLSLDYSFPDWHDLTRCYTGQGWAIENQSVRTTGPGFVEVDFGKAAYRSGYLLFTEFDRGGDLLEPRLGGALLSLYRHDSVLRHWWSGDSRSAPRSPAAPVYQLQVFVETNTPLNQSARVELQALFIKALETLRGRNEGHDPVVGPDQSTPRGR